MKVFKSLLVVLLSLGIGSAGLYFGAKYIGREEAYKTPTEIVEESENTESNSDNESQQSSEDTNDYIIIENPDLIDWDDE